MNIQYMTTKEILGQTDNSLKNSFYKQTSNFTVDDICIIKSECNKIIKLLVGHNFKLLTENDKKKLLFTNCLRCYIINEKEITSKLLMNEFIVRFTFERSSNMSNNNPTFIENIAEEQESFSDDSLYNITSFGTDLTFRELIMMYDDGDLEKPDLQRNYVWTKKEASRFIDSILLGLPVPSIFLAKTKDNKRLIVDGLQRIMTVYDYINGTFRGDNTPFKLSKADNINAQWRGKAYNELSSDEQRAIRVFPIHAIIFEQKQPKNDTGMYQIFERINTGGRVLKPQEIRNCVYHSDFNDLLKELNHNQIWRDILSLQEPDSRMCDIELILRFFALYDFKTFLNDYNSTQINLLKFLNDYMNNMIHIKNDRIVELKKLFMDTITFLSNKIGINVFHSLSSNKPNGKIIFTKKINPVIFDSISVATAYAIHNNKINENNLESLYKNYIALIKNEKYIEITKARTTNVENIKLRISMACKYLYGVEYEW